MISAQLATFSGTLQVDGYGAHKALLKDERAAGAIQLGVLPDPRAARMVSHVQFDESHYARRVVERIAAVYAIEKAIRGLDADQRRAIRAGRNQALDDSLESPAG